MKQLYIAALLLAANIGAYSQSFTPVVINNGGGAHSTGGLTFEWSIGESFTETLTSGNSFTLGVLQPLNTAYSGPLPVNRLEFYAKRINNTQVQLDWKTSEEYNNKGFRVERRKENESGFTEIDFVNSKAINGTSTVTLQYSRTDNNNFSGPAYYRLQQQDLDGQFSYSVVRMVKGDMDKQVSLNVWPVPAVGFFNVSVTGLNKTDLLLIIDMNGRLVKQFNVQNQTQQQVSGLPPGTYFIRLGSDKTVGQKIILQ